MEFLDAETKTESTYKNVPFIWYTKGNGSQFAWKVDVGSGWSSGWWDSEHDAKWELRQYIDSHYE